MREREGKGNSPTTHTQAAGNDSVHLSLLQPGPRPLPAPHLLDSRGGRLLHGTHAVRRQPGAAAALPQRPLPHQSPDVGTCPPPWLQLDFINTR